MTHDPVPMANITDITEESFAAEVEHSRGITIVDFWATWCGPCKAIAPILEQVAVERAGTVKVVKVNADEYPKVQMRFNVRGLPTLLLFKDGALVDRIVGAMPKSHLDGVIEKALA